MQDYEYRDKGGRHLCRLHHRLRCDECHYVSELQEQNKRYREVMKRAIDILKYVPSEKTPKKDVINALQDALKGGYEW